MKTKVGTFFRNSCFKETLRSWKICISTFSGKCIWLCPSYSYTCLYHLFNVLSFFWFKQIWEMTKIFRSGSKNLFGCHIGHWHHMMVDGANFWIGYQRLAFLSICSHWQQITNLATLCGVIVISEWLKQNWFPKRKFGFFDEGPKIFWDQSKINLEQ